MQADTKQLWWVRSGCRTLCVGRWWEIVCGCLLVSAWLLSLALSLSRSLSSSSAIPFTISSEYRPLIGIIGFLLNWLNLEMCKATVTNQLFPPWVDQCYVSMQQQHICIFIFAIWINNTTDAFTVIFWTWQDTHVEMNISHSTVLYHCTVHRHIIQVEIYGSMFACFSACSKFWEDLA